MKIIVIIIIIIIIIIITILGGFNFTMDKTDRDGGSKTERLYKYGSNYALSRLILDNGIENLWRRENSDFSEFTQWDRFSGRRSRIEQIYTDITIASNSKINHIMLYFTDQCTGISLERLPSETKIRKD